MNPIEFTEDHESKLLEMCNALFPEYKSIELWNFDSYDDFCGLGGNEKINNCICFYPGKLPLNKENPPRIDWENIQKTNIPIAIHWFEFCMTHLTYKLIDELKKNQQDKEVDLFFRFNSKFHIYGNDLMYSNPIDYLYEQFKQLK